MFVGRAQEIKFLTEYYSRPENNLIIVYGRKGNGKTELLRGFGLNKKCLYYSARECSEKEQLLTLKKEWQENYGVEGTDLSFASLFSAGAKDYSLIVVDEFNQIIKNTEYFMEGVLSVLNEVHPDHKLMIVLVSSSINWVENNMVSEIGRAALQISAFLKIKEFTFPDVVTRFPNYSVEESIGVYGILGGVPGYLNFWNEKRTRKENIIALFLHKDGRLYREAENYLKTELRELALYNTILATLAGGKLKLNDIYARTGFSRAKISVYIKNLIELDVVEKVFSYDTEGKENTKKGLYRIKDRFLHFWYRFVFPNLSNIENRQAERVYNEKIAPFLDEYLSQYFVTVCQEYFQLMSDYQKLPFEIEQMGEWYGKEGTIDFMGEGKDKSLFVGKCKWDREPMAEQDFMDLLALNKQAGVEPDYYYLFSKSGFTSSFEVKAKEIHNLVLTNLTDL